MQVAARLLPFRSATFSVGGTNSATLREDVSSILMHLDGRQVALSFEPSVTTSSDLLGRSKARPPFYGVIYSGNVHLQTCPSPTLFSFFDWQLGN